MQKFRLIQWCEKATCQISFGPDRRKVTDELMGHLEDRRDALMAQGIDERTATDQALESMGDAMEIAPQLGALHKPFWGYALRVSKLLLILLLCLSVIPVWNYFWNLDIGTSNLRDFEIYNAASYGGSTGRTLHHLSRPNETFTSDGNTFTVTDAAVFTETTADGAKKTRLYIRLNQSSLLPWSEHKDYFGTFTNFTNIGSLIYAVDSLGNTYQSFQKGYPDHQLVHHGNQTGVFTYTHECWINDFPAEAQWVEFRYERDGRSCCVRVYLAGGDRT